MNHHLTNRLLATGAVAAVALGGGGLVATSAAANSRTLRFFQESGQARFENAAGKPINLNPPANGLPVKGDSFEESDLDFAGTAAHHSKHWTATDNLYCRFDSSSTATCDVAIAIGGSMLLGMDERLNLAGASTRLKLKDGTGAFRGEHGSLTATNLPNSNDATFVISIS